MKTFVLFAMLLASQVVHAFTPWTGTWWNPNESGRGYSIDIQDDTMFLTAYAYDADGMATWYTAVGTYDRTSNTFTATLDAAKGGQCFGCVYSKPIVMPAGAITIQFTSSEAGLLTFPGGSTSITHMLYGYPSRAAFLLGQWVLSLNALDSSGDSVIAWWVTFDSMSIVNGVEYVNGHVDSSGPNPTSFQGYYDDASGSFRINQSNVGFGPSFDFTFSVLDDRSMSGYRTCCPPNISPQPAYAGRILFRSELPQSGALGPSGMKATDAH